MTSAHPPIETPFEFLRVTFLVEVTPYRAASLGQLLTGMTLAPELSIFYHLHQRFFREPERLPEYPDPHCRVREPTAAGPARCIIEVSPPEG